MCVLNSFLMPTPACVVPCTGMDRYGNCPVAPANTKVIDFAHSPAKFALRVSRIYGVSRDLISPHAFHMTVRGTVTLGTTVYPSAGEATFPVTVMMNGVTSTGAAETDAGKEMEFTFVDTCYKIALESMTLMKLNFNATSTASNVGMSITSENAGLGTGLLTTDLSNKPLDLAFYGYYQWLATNTGACSIIMPQTSSY
jgi:hypothetical protein